MKYYLAGPMTGYPKFNFPLFTKVTADLREKGMEIVSPVETDEPDMQEIAWKSKDGTHDEQFKETWGQVLAKDVELIADHIDGIILLPDWQKSKGARLECFVGLGCKLPISLWREGNDLQPVTASYLLDEIRWQVAMDYDGGPKEGWAV